MKLSENIYVKQGDCLELMSKLPEKYVDLILCDLPYGTTACKWDSVIPLDSLWKQYDRIVKDNGAILLFSQEPFTTSLIFSNIDKFKLKYIWIKNRKTGFPMCNFRPLKQYEEICLFSKNPYTYTGNKNYVYNPQGIVEVNKPIKRKQIESIVVNNGGKIKPLNNQQYEGYPSDILFFSSDSHSVHPTQKPVALLEHLIKTYTNEKDIVLDNTAGSFSTGVACINTNRKFIGYELDDKYFEVGKNRLIEAINNHMK